MVGLEYFFFLKLSARQTHLSIGGCRDLMRVFDLWERIIRQQQSKRKDDGAGDSVFHDGPFLLGRWGSSWVPAGWV